MICRSAKQQLTFEHNALSYTSITTRIGQGIANKITYFPTLPSFLLLIGYTQATKKYESTICCLFTIKQHIAIPLNIILVGDVNRITKKTT